MSEVAARLQCSTSFAYSLVRSGRLRHYRLGKGQGGIRVGEGHLREYLCGAEKGGEPRPKPKPPARPVTLKHLQA